MSISINGDGIISGVSTLTNPSEITVGTGASVFSPSANTLALGTNGTERVRIDSSGNVGIGTAVPTVNLQIQDDGSFSLIRMIAASNNVAGIDFGDAADADIAGIRYSNSDDSMSFRVNASERGRFDSSGRLLVGTSSARTNFHGGSVAYQQQIEGTAYNTSAPAFICDSNTAGHGPHVTLARSRGTSVGSNTVVQSDDVIGVLNFQGNDGTNFVNCARIITAVDGTPGANDMPGRLVFSTTADGASSPTERMRLNSNGGLLIGYTSTANGGSGVVSAVGYAHKQGTGNSPGSSAFNFFWNGSLQAWIDTSNVGNVTLTSDYRIKKNIETQTNLAIPRLKQLRPVTYERANYGTLFTEDGVAREGFIAHEVAEVIPSGVEGEKDAENQIQSLNIDAIVSVLTKALQEAVAKIETLEAANASQAATIAALDARLTALEGN